MLHSQHTNNYLGIQAVHSNPSPKHNGTTQRNTARSFHCTRRGKACIARYRLVKEHKHADNKVQTYPGILKNNVRITAVFRTPAPWTPKLRSTLMQIEKNNQNFCRPPTQLEKSHCTLHIQSWQACSWSSVTNTSLQKEKCRTSPHCCSRFLSYSCQRNGWSAWRLMLHSDMEKTKVPWFTQFCLG
jgi:hypothetical protein